MGVKVIRPPGRNRWYLSICHKGKRETRAVGGREAAFIAKRDIEAAIGAGTFVFARDAKDQVAATENMTFEKAFEKWTKEHVEVRLKPSTIRYYASLGSEWLVPMFGDREVASIVRMDVKAAIARWKEYREHPPEVAEEPEDGKKKRRKLAPGKGLRTIPNALRALRSFYSWAIEEGLASGNPASDPSKMFKLDMPFHGDYLRPEEVSPYLDGLKKKAPRYFPILRTMTFTGLRVGEALGLEWGDFERAGDSSTSSVPGMGST